MQSISRRDVLRATAFAGLTGFSSRSFAAEGAENPLVGDWTYRSFISDPDPNTPFNDLQFAVAALTFEKSPFGQIAGRLRFGDDFLALRGTITYGNPFTVRFQGVGATPGTIEQGRPWVYDYLGFVAPAWPNGIDQRPAIVGTIVRTVPHSQGRAKAGVVASWIALRKDAETPPPIDPNEQLPKLESGWAAAAMTNNPDEIGRYLAKDFLFVGAGGILQSRAEHLEDFRSGRLKVSSVEIKDTKVAVYDSSAVVNSLSFVVGKLPDRDIKGDYRFMDTWLFQNRQWLAVARQQTAVATK